MTPKAIMKIRKRSMSVGGAGSDRAIKLKRKYLSNFFFDFWPNFRCYWV